MAQAAPVLAQHPAHGIQLPRMRDRREVFVVSAFQDVPRAPHLAVQRVALSVHHGLAVQQQPVHVARSVGQPLQRAQALRLRGRALTQRAQGVGDRVFELDGRLGPGLC